MSGPSSYSRIPSNGDKERLDVLVLEKVMPFPPANAGDAVYSRGIIQSLALFMNVTVLCADGGGAATGDDGVAWHVTAPQRRGQAGSVASRWPLLAWKGATREYHAELDRLLEKDWNAIVLDNLGTVHALPKVLKYRLTHPNTKLVYVSHEYEYEIRRGKYGAYSMGFVKGLAARFDLLKVRRAETRLLRELDLVTVINPNDLAPFKHIAPEQNYLTLTPGYDGPVNFARRITPDVPRRVLMLGGRKSHQKRQILLDWMRVGYGPLTKAGIEIVIVGDMDEDLRAELTQTWPKVKVYGFVKDLAELIASARIGLIADTVGGGFKLRLLSHIFQRLPIVGLDDAVDGLPTSKGAGYLVAKDLLGLAQLVLEVIDDTDRLDALQTVAFDDCRTGFSWMARGEELAHALNPPRQESNLTDIQTGVGTEP